MLRGKFAPGEERPERAERLTAGLIAGGHELIEAEAFGQGPRLAVHAPDYLRFLRALLRGGELDGERVLKSETVELALGDHLDGAPLPEIMRSAMPELSNDVPSLPFAQGWGLGFHLFLEDLPGLRRSGSADWGGLFNCSYWIDRASGVTGVFLTQVLPFYDARIVETAAGFELGVYAGVGALHSA